MNHASWNRRIRRMFGSIAHRYDFMNTLMSFGMDRSWRRRTVELAGLPASGLMLDVGAGTGRIILEAARRHPDARFVAADITPEMMQVGRRATPRRARWCCANALELPFGDAAFDAVVSGFLVRNVPDIAQAFAEQHRVLKPGGRVVCLDAGPPPDTVLKPLVRIHLNWVIPLLGGLITGDLHAYRYLPDSTQAFKTAEEVAGIMEEAGFSGIRYERRMMGTINIVHGMKPC
ncbi:MAG TPA: ubiquinone/menaquinone biosynthesis methyltransferase [Deltaproteobacteria bacterium]|nr:ubiquinone/menaquinone biosynthesis methyltransferase [Deltaproteobacteria bacterium]